MKIAQDFKDFIRDFVFFFRKEFFADTYRNDFFCQNNKTFFSKYLRTKKSKAIILKAQDDSIAKILENVSERSVVSRKN
jgi:hypothetical protein